MNGKDETREVLDFQTMYSTLNAGIINRTINKTIIEFLSSLCLPAIPRAIDHTFHAPAIRAVQGFTGMDQVLFKSGGAEAVETACNIAFQFWSQNNASEHKTHGTKFPLIISAKNNFHGRTRIPRSLSSSPSCREGFGPLLENIKHVPFGNVDSIKKIVHTHHGDVAAIVLEPIQGEGGVIIPTENYLQEVEKICRENNILFVLDEIQTGFGRTGTDWAFERSGVKPDLLCGGKAASGGIVPVSFVAGRKDVMSCLKPGTEGATWSATPIQCVAVMAAIKEVCDHNLSEQSEQKGNYLQGLLVKLAHKYPDIITDIRGKGLFVGIDTVYEGAHVSHALLGEGLWAKETGEDGKTIRLSPPLMIPKEKIHEAVGIIEKTILNMK